MTIYGTFDGFKNYKDKASQLKWSKVTDEVGYDLIGEYYTEEDKAFKNIKLKFGERYMIGCDAINGNNAINVIKIIKVYKNPRCDIFRKFKDEYHIIGGKYQGKKVHEMPKQEMIDYVHWLGSNTQNERTIKNALEILKKLTKNE